MDNMIGQRIKNRRKEMNITQTQIQQEAGISSGNLSGIENGKYLPSTAALLELSKILNCSIDWILTGESLNSENSSFSNFKEGSDEDILLKCFHGMSREDQEEFLMIAQMKYNRVKKNKNETKRLSSSDQGQGTVETA